MAGALVAADKPFHPVPAVESANATVDLKLTNADGSLPAHVSEEVVREVLRIARKIAVFGLAPKHPAHGFTFIAGDAIELLRRDEEGHPIYGECGQEHFNAIV